MKGNSGGPLIDQEGKILAVASGYLSQSHNHLGTCLDSATFSSVQGLEKALANWGSSVKKEDLNCR